MQRGDDEVEELLLMKRLGLVVARVRVEAAGREAHASDDVPLHRLEGERHVERGSSHELCFVIELRVRPLETVGAEDIAQIAREHAMQALVLKREALRDIAIVRSLRQVVRLLRQERRHPVALWIRIEDLCAGEGSTDAPHVANRERHDSPVEIVADIRRREAHRDRRKELLSSELVRDHRVDA